MLKKILPLGAFIGILLILTSSNVLAVGDPITISNTTNDTVYPQTVTDASGYLHAAWMEVEPGRIWSSHQNPGIYYSRWNGDTWSTPTNISNNTGFAEMPAIAADTTGTIHAVWDDETVGSNFFPGVAYRTRSSAGTWSSIETIPLPGSLYGAFNTRVATSNSNIPHVVFDGYSLSGDSIYWTKKTAGVWDTPIAISEDESGNDLTSAQWSDLRVDASGSMHLVYWNRGSGIYYRVYNGSAWSTPINLVNSGSIRFTRMATTPNGEVFVSWFDRDDNSVRVRWTVSGIWQTQTTLTTLGTSSFFGLPIMGITTDSKNRVHVGWGERDSGDGLIDLKYRSYVSGIWGTAQDVDLNNQDADSPFIYPDKWDNQHFMWSEKNASTGIWEIRYRVAEGTIQNVTTSGGTVTANPNNVTEATLSIPNGALSSAQDISIQVGPVPENVDSQVVTLPKAYTFRPHGLTFNSAVTASIFYTDTDVAGADERALKPWFWNSLTNSWESQTGTNRPSQNRIDVDLTHFSLYGISAPKVVTTFTAPLANQMIKQGSLVYEFSLKYADGSPILPITSPDDLTVALKGSTGQTFSIAKQDDIQIVKDTSKGTYKDVLHFQQNDIPPGEYTFEVYLAGNLVGSQSFTLSR